jgi:hypothetical protein
MKSGIPWQVAEVGRSGRREPASLGDGDVSVAKGPDRPDDGGYRRLESPENDRSAGDRDDRAVPTAAPFAFAVTPGAAGATPTRQPGRVETRVDTLRVDLAEIHLMLQEARPRSVIEALQHEISRLGERADKCRRTGIDAAVVAAIESRLAEIRDALRTLRPAESLLGMARVVQQLSHKINIIAGAWDAAVLEQLEGAVAAMRSVVSHAASHEALAKLSEEVRALGAKLDHARSRADGRTLSTLETRMAMLAEQLQARDRSGPDVSDELKVLIEGLVERIDRMELTSATSAASARLENLVEKLVEKLHACDARLDQLATTESTLAELLIHIGRRQAPILGRDPGPPPAVEALSRDVADLRQTEKQTQDSLEVAHGTLAHLVDRLAMIETDMRGKPPHLLEAPAPASAAPPLATRAAPKAPLPREEPATPPAQPATDPYPTDSLVPSDRPLESGSGAASDPNPDGLVDRGILPEAALSGGTSTFIAAARRAAQVASRSVSTENEPSSIEVGPDDRSAGQRGKLGALIGGMIVIMVLGVLQVMGFLPYASEAEVNALPETAATTSENIALPSMRGGQAAGPVLASEDHQALPVLSPARRQLDLFRYIGGTIITTPAPGPVVPGWTLEQLLEAQMSSSEHWNDATSGFAAAVSAPARRKLPAVGPALEPGPPRPAQ